MQDSSNFRFIIDSIFETLDLRVFHRFVIKFSKIEVHEEAKCEQKIAGTELVICQNLHYVKPKFFCFKA